MASDDFFEPPKRMASEYGRHLLLIALDCGFLLCWALLIGGCHAALDWIVENIGLGPVDQVVKWAFEIAFGGVTFFWVIRVVWKVHSHAYHRSWPKRQPRKKHEVDLNPP